MHSSSLARTLAGVVALLALLAAAPTVHAWGPISHYNFACTAAAQSTFLPGAPDLQAMLIGSDLPDGMWNGWFLSGTKCSPQANAMHSPILAGYMLRAAMQNVSDADNYYISLAYGYATHVVSDEVGFASQGGYLGNVSAIIDWSTEWPFMLSVDAYLLNNGVWPTECPNATSQPRVSLDQRGVDFIAEAVATYRVDAPSFPNLDSAAIAACSDPWGPQVNRMNAIAATQLPAATSQQLIFFDQFGATTEAQAADNLAASMECIQYVLTYYFDQIAIKSQSVQQSWANTAEYIVDLFEDGKCTTA